MCANKIITCIVSICLLLWIWKGVCEFALLNRKIFHPTSSSLADDDTLNIVSQLMIGKAYPSLVDFDNHLDDLSLDWLNPEINKVVDNASAQVQD